MCNLEHTDSTRIWPIRPTTRSCLLKLQDPEERRGKLAKALTQVGEEALYRAACAIENFLMLAKTVPPLHSAAQHCPLGKQRKTPHLQTAATEQLLHRQASQPACVVSSSADRGSGGAGTVEKVLKQLGSVFGGGYSKEAGGPKDSKGDK